MTRAELDARGIDAPDVVLVTGDAYVDHPSFAMAILGRWLESLGYQRRHPRPARLEERRAVARPRPAAALLRRQRRQHGLDDQSLHGEPEAAERRRLLAGRPHRAPTRPADARLLPALPRGLPRRARHRGRRRSLAAPARALRLLVRHGAAVDPRADSKCDLLVHGMGERAIREIADRLAAGEDVKGLRDIRGVAYLLGASETPPADAVELPSYEDVAARTPDGLRVFAEATRTIHRETNPLQRAPPDPAPRRPRGRGEPARDAARRARRWTRVYGLPYLRTPHPSYTRGHPRRRDDPRLRHDHAGLLRRLHVLLDHDAPGPHHLVALRGLGAARGDGRWPPIADLQGDGERPRRPDGQHVPDALHASPRSEQICRRLSCVHPKICKLLGTDHGPAHRPDAEGARRAGRQARVQRRQRASAWTWPAVDPRYIRELAAHHVGGHLKVAPGAHRPAACSTLMKKPGGRGLRRVRAAVQGRLGGGGQAEAVPGALLHREPPGLRRWRR